MNEVTQSTKSVNVIFVHAALDDLGLNPEEFRIYCHLARRAGKGVAYSGVDAMAKVCRMGDKTVRKGLKVLIAKNLVTYTIIPGRPTQYFLTDFSEWRRDNNEPDTPAVLTTPAVLDPSHNIPGAPATLDQGPLPCDTRGPSLNDHPKYIPKVNPRSKSHEVERGDAQELPEMVESKSQKQSAKPKASASKLPEVLDSAQSQKAWADFASHRKAFRSVPFTDVAIERIIAKLLELTEHEFDRPAIAAKLLNTAIERGWKTVYPDRERKMLPTDYSKF